MSIDITTHVKVYCAAGYHAYPLEFNIDGIAAHAAIRSRIRQAGWTGPVGYWICPECRREGKEPRKHG